MNILIFSDTHRNIDDVLDIIHTESEVNAIIHAGDYEADAQKIQREFPQIPVYSVPGNGDYLSRSSADLETTICGKKIFITHGHNYNVKYGLSQIMNKAAYGNYDMIVFGHTHKSIIEYFGGTIIVNPGTAGYYPKTYAKAVIENNELKVCIEQI